MDWDTFPEIMEEKKKDKANLKIIYLLLRGSLCPKQWRTQGEEKRYFSPPPMAVLKYKKNNINESVLKTYY